MATITARSSGNASSGATWIGGVTPGPADDVVIPSGATVTVDGASSWRSFLVQVGGTLVIADGGTLTFSADSLVRGLNYGRADRLVVAAGGTLQHDAPGDVNLHLGGDWYEMGRFVCNGTAGKRATVRRKAGNAASHLTIVNGPAGAPVTGAALVSFAYCDLADVSLDVTFKHPGDGGMIASDLDHCTVTRPRKWFAMQTSGGAATADYVRHRVVGTTFGGFAQAPGAVMFRLLTASHALGEKALVFEDNAFGRGGVRIESFNANPGAASAANVSIRRNVFEHNVTLGSASAPFGDGAIGENFRYIRQSDAGPGNYELHGFEDDPFLLFHDEGDGYGNPHYYALGGTSTIRRGTWDYVGPYGVDNGDPIDVFAGGQCTATHGLVLRAGPGVSAGSLWSLTNTANPSATPGRLDIDRFTIYSPRGYSGVMLAERPYIGTVTGLVKVRNTLCWSDVPGGGGNFLGSNVADEIPQDYAKAADFHHNAMYGLGTYAANRIGAASGVSLKGFNGVRMSAAPTALDLAAPPGFAHPERNFLWWCRVERGHNAGDDIADALAGLADLKADTSLIADLRTKVRAGFATSNPALAGAASDGGTIGAIGAGVAPPVPTIQTGRTGPHDPSIAGYDPADDHTPDFGGFTFFSEAPAGNPLKELVRRVDSDPAYRHSDAIMACYAPGGLASYAGLMPGWAWYGTAASNNRFAGFGLSVVDSGTDALLPVTYRAEPVADWDADTIYSEPLGAAFPADARVQGHNGNVPPSVPVIANYGVADAHAMVVDRATGRVYETYHTYKHPTDGWIAASGWYYDMNTGDWCPGVPESDPRHVPAGKHRFPATLVNAAGLPMLPLMLRYDEVYTAGEVKHAIGVTLPNVKIAGTWTWPARGMAYMNLNRWGGPWGMTIPYGGRFRLRASWYHANVRDAGGGLVAGPDTPAGGWGQGALVILKAMKEYGLIVTDGGMNFDLWAVQDSRWPWAGDLADLQSVRCDRFEVVDFEDDLLDISVAPEMAAPGVERTVSITYRGWERHPEEHPGRPEYVLPGYDADDQKSRPYQYAVELLDQVSKEYLGNTGTSTRGDGLLYGIFARMTPGAPTVTFKVTPGMENRRFFPFTSPGFGSPWAYGDGVPFFKTSETPLSLAITPSPATVPPGGTRQFTATASGCGQGEAWWYSDFPDTNGYATPPWASPMDRASGLFSDLGTASSGTITAWSLADPNVTTTASVRIGAASVSDDGPAPPPVPPVPQPATSTLLEPLHPEDAIATSPSPGLHKPLTNRSDSQSKRDPRPKRDSPSSVDRLSA
jgi:hypothetical protein